MLEQFVNTVMGVKAGNQQHYRDTLIATTQELDIRAILVYTLGTLLQIVVMILVLLGMEKLVILIDNNSSFPSWFSTLLTGLLFALLSIRSRIFSLLDNTRSRQTYDQVIIPRWSPPPLVFPIVWMIIAALRVINFFCIDLAANESPIFSAAFTFVCGTSGFRGYLEYDFYCRTEIRCCCSCSYFRPLVICCSGDSNLLAN